MSNVCRPRTGGGGERRRRRRDSRACPSPSDVTGGVGLLLNRTVSGRTDAARCGPFFVVRCVFLCGDEITIN